MNYQMPYATNKLDKVMSQEQFDLVVDAILAGKYSWACVLILRFGGHNPLHYIPYRTYNRLMKQHRQGRAESGHRSKDYSDNQEEQSTGMKEITYLEVVENQNKEPRSGVGNWNANYQRQESSVRSR